MTATATAAAARRTSGALLGGWLPLVGLLALAALLRLPSLATRGTWDADQGHDMLVLRALVRDGVIPLLGPPTSIGNVHHGALYYYLLAPAAFLTGGDSPLAVVTEIALAGIAAVGVTWWLARDIGGPIAGLAAGLIMAVSASAVDESTFIWNPNLIALSSAIALAGAWRAWTTGRPAWWLVSAIGLAVTMQCHVLGVTLLPILAAMLVADARARRSRPERVAILAYGLTGLLIVVVAFVPLAIHELTTDFSEIRAALDYMRAGGEASALGPAARLVVVGTRVVAWPLTGLITDAIIPAVLVTAGVLLSAVLLARYGETRERQAARWLGLGLVWTTVFLVVVAPGLAEVVAGLPNDHYHAFADPMVFVLVGLAVGALWRTGSAAWRTGSPGSPQGSRAAALVSLAGLAVFALAAWNLTRQPPAINPDGGFPAADDAASRIQTATGSSPIFLSSLPVFKTPEAYQYPLVRGGATVRASDRSIDPMARQPASGESLVIVCDALFEPAIGAACGGPAEAVIAPADVYGSPVDRFEAAPGRTITVYRPAP